MFSGFGREERGPRASLLFRFAHNAPDSGHHVGPMTAGQSRAAWGQDAGERRLPPQGKTRGFWETLNRTPELARFRDLLHLKRHGNCDSTTLTCVLRISGEVLACDPTLHAMKLRGGWHTIGRGKSPEVQTPVRRKITWYCPIRLENKFQCQLSNSRIAIH